MKKALMSLFHPTLIAALLLALPFLAPTTLLSQAIQNPDQPSPRWSEEKANQWYASQPWPCGFNYIPANAISYTEMWMPYCFNRDTIENELDLAEETGFNCLRVVLPYVVWEHDPDAFKKRLKTFLKICDKRGIGVMFTLFDDCHFASDPELKDPWYGKQPDVLEGWYANGWTPSPGHSIVKDPAQWPKMEKYVKDIVSSFNNDPRVWVWDLYNEPGNSGTGNDTSSLVENVFHWARECHPSQPLTIAVWNWDMKQLNETVLKHSDIITFHDYNDPETLARHIDVLKEHNRPVINTEWLNRPRNSTVQACLPVFHEKNAGCMHWGLVNGKTQTHLHWGWRPGMGVPEVWQHDLFHNDHTPYDPQELKLFSKYTGR